MLIRAVISISQLAIMAGKCSDLLTSNLADHNLKLTKGDQPS